MDTDGMEEFLDLGNRAKNALMNVAGMSDEI